MRIAFIFNWHYNMQRPHHWVIQAVKRGHEADVYSTAGKMPWKPLLVPYKYATRVICPRPKIMEALLYRLGGQKSLVFRLLHEHSVAQSVRLWENLWNGVTKEQYDAVVYCGKIPCIVNRKSRKIPLVYDCMDQWDGFPNAHPRILEFEGSLAKVADIIWAVTPDIAERLSARHGKDKCHVVPNACDYDHFSSATEKRYPSIWKPNTKIVGYAGVVSSWFDWDAVLAVANALPDTIVWILGTCHSDIPQNLPSNIVLEGFVPYEHLPEYYAGFDVCIIPFKGDVLLKGVSPIKLYEYLAAGKPVVSSKMADAMRLASPGILEVAITPEDFVRSCSRLLDEAGNETFIQRRRELAQSHSWTARWEMCERLISGFKKRIRH